MGPAGFTSPSRKKNVTWPSCVSAGLLLNFGRSSLSRCKARFSIKLHSWSGQSWFMCQPGDRLSSFLITFSHVTRVSSCLSPTGPSVWRGENLPLKKKKGGGGGADGGLWTHQPLSQLLKAETSREKWGDYRKRVGLSCLMEQSIEQLGECVFPQRLREVVQKHLCYQSV